MNAWELYTIFLKCDIFCQLILWAFGYNGGMSEGNPEKPSDKKKPFEGVKPREARDIQKWPEAIKKAKLEAKNERRALMDQIEAEDSLAKLFDTSSKSTKESQKPSWEYSSLASTEGNRISGDEKRGTLEGIAQSLLAPFKAGWNLVSDTGKFIRSPKWESERTIAYLEEANPDIQNI